ncbi:MAG TPA: hypothetical protein VI854_06350 [Acidimicrobiia bacterium]|nr:hypothetical protein [Acidimicrobiia bacterium]
MSAITPKPTRTRIGAALAATGLAIIGAGLVATPSYADPITDGSCNGVFNGGRAGTVVVTTDPAEGTEIQPGDVISVSTTWDIGDEHSVSQIKACVEVDGDGVAAMTDEEQPVVNDGLYEHEFTVPLGTPVGTAVCLRLVVFGDPRTGGGAHSSDVVCFEVAATPDTTAPTTTSSTTTTSTTTTSTTTTSTTRPVGDPQIEPEVLGEQVGTGGGAGTTAPGALTNNPVSGNPASGGDVAAQVAVAPQVVTGPVSAELPRTGSGTRDLLMLAGWSLLLGGLALAVGRQNLVAGR